MAIVRQRVRRRARANFIFHLTRSSKFIMLLLPIALLLIAAACRSGAKSPAAVAHSESWDGYVNQFLEGYFAARPDVAVIAGRHEFDGKLPNWSAAGIRGEINRLHAHREKATSFKDDALDERQRFERDYLVAQCDKDLFWLEKAR